MAGEKHVKEVEKNSLDSLARSYKFSPLAIALLSKRHISPYRARLTAARSQGITITSGRCPAISETTFGERIATALQVLLTASHLLLGSRGFIGLCWLRCCGLLGAATQDQNGYQHNCQHYGD